MKKPMYLGIIKANLEAHKYASPHEVADDVRLLCNNCRSYYGVQHPITSTAATLLTEFEKKYAQIASMYKQNFIPAGVKHTSLELVHMHGHAEAEEVAQLYLSHFRLVCCVTSNP